MKSLRQTLLVWMLLAFAAVLALAGGTMYLAAGRAFRHHLDETLAARARSFASLVRDANEPPDPGEPEGGAGIVLGDILEETNVGVHVRVLDAEGEVVARSSQWAAWFDPALPAPAEADEPLATDAELWTGEPARAVVILTRVVPDAEQIRAGADPTPRAFTVQVLGDMTEVSRAQGAVLAALALAGLIAAAGVVAAVTLVTRRAVAPIRELSTELASVRPGSGQTGFDAGRYPVEMRPILDALSDLFERVDSAMARERRFTDAAAHELRTPIAELRSLADVAERWPEPDRLRRSMGEVRLAAEDMASLVESLLGAARGHGGDTDEAVGEVEVMPIVRGALSTHDARLCERGVVVECGGSDTASLRCTRGAALVIVRNLVDNAAEYTPEGGRIRVRVDGHGPVATLTIENSLVALSPEQVEQMFEPFWRADSARSDRRHHGLGLAIVATMCESAGLVCRAELIDDGSLRVTVTPGAHGCS